MGGPQDPAKTVKTRPTTASAVTTALVIRCALPACNATHTVRLLN